MSKEREPRSCTSCAHWSICPNRHSKAIEVLDSKEEDILKKLANECEYWRDDCTLEPGIAHRDTLAEIMRMAEKGEVVVVNLDGGRTFSVVGGYPNMEIAKLAATGQHCIVIAKV